MKNIFESFKSYISEKDLSDVWESTEILSEAKEIKEFNLTDDEMIFAKNEARWSWEYDSQSRTLNLILNKETLELSVVIEERASSSGINRHSWVYYTKYDKLGTFNKPKLAEINKIKKKHNFEKSSASRPMTTSSWSVYINGKEIDYDKKLKEVFTNEKLLAALKFSLFEIELEDLNEN